MKNSYLNFMARLISVCLLASLLLASEIFAKEEVVVIPKSTYEAILNKLDTLQKKVDNLEKKGAQVEKKTTALDSDINDIYDTLDKVETKTIKDRINWGFELRTRMDNFKVSDQVNPITREKDDFSADNHWTTRFRLNMNAELLKGLTFYGRLTVYKNWANSQRVAYYPYADPNMAHVPSDTSLKLDRAYIDWIVPNSPVPLAFTIGRQPSSEGPAYEFKENRKRQSTYPVLLFDGEADGIVATIGLERYIGLKNSGLRFAYGKGYQSQDDKSVYLDSRYGIDDLNVFGFFFESELPYLPNSLMVLSYVRGNDFVDNPVDPGKNLGDMDLFGIHLQAPNILESGFDFFFSWGMNISHPNGEYVNMPVGIGSDGQPVTMPVGLLSSNGKDDHTGWAIYTGFRYTVPFAMLNNPKVGFEYNHGSKNWFSFTQGSTELYNKLATRGDVFDFYYIQPFNKYLFMRVGYTIVNYNYTGSGWHIGEAMETDESLKDFYFLLDCHF